MTSPAAMRGSSTLRISAIAVVLVASQFALSGCFGPPPSAAKLKLVELADKLVVANKHGDPKLAISGIEGVSGLLQKLNDDPQSSRACVLAAVALVDGFEAVYRGGRWGNSDRFDANMAQCS